MQAPAPTLFRDLTKPYDIRLLRLDAGSRNTPLTGSLEHTNLAYDPRYEALSYEWGRQERTELITLQHGFTLSITESLHGALEDLRQDMETQAARVLWIDSICINQLDIPELQSQVSIMTHIYRYATRVVTYIGPERDGSTEAIHFARTLCRHAVGKYVRDLSLESPATGIASPSLPPESDPRWKAVKALTLRTWASRCWCAQEFLQNRKHILMCGTTRIPDWYLMSDIVENVVNRYLATSLLPAPSEDPDSLRECLAFMSELRSSVLYEGARMSLRQLLERFHPFRATDPRDKVYSILGLADDREDLGIAVDYACTAEQLYIRVASKILQASPVVRILYNCLDVKSLALPSWVPDWSTWRFGSRGARLSRGYDACGSTPDELRVDGMKLHVAGCLVGEIAHVGEPIGPHYVFPDRGIAERKAWLLKERADISRVLGPGFSSEYIDEVLWRTLIGNITVSMRPAGQEYQKLYNAHLDYDGHGGSTEVATAAREFCDAVRRRSRYRRLAVTKRGDVGAVPVTAEVGDWVSMFQGGRLLFVVRSRGIDYSYVGHAYVHGLMHGEVLKAEWYRKQTMTLV